MIMEPLNTTITNTSTHNLRVSADGFEYAILRPGRKCVFKFYPDDTVLPEIECERLDVDRKVRVSSSNFLLWAEIAFYTTPDDFVRWFGRASRDSEIDDQELNHYRSVASTRMNSVVSLSNKLTSHLEKIKICSEQCKYLVETFLKGIQGMEKNYTAVFRTEFSILRLYESKKLRILVNCLASLENFLLYTENFLSECGKEWKYFALEVCVPLSPSTKFDLLMGELSWNLDKIRYALCMEEGFSRVEWKWSSKRCRHVLVKLGGDPDHEDDIGGSSLRVNDRVNLECLVGDALSFEQTMPRMRNEKAATREAFRLILKERLRSGISASFFIDHKTLKLQKIIGRGNSKDIFKGVWLGQDVAIAIIAKRGEELDVRKEAEYLVELQHPNIVVLYGWSHAREVVLPAPKRRTAAGYLVMELMERDLFEEIEIQRKSKGPFSISIALDILLQIVEAMVYLHKREIMHRDLKTLNCVVKPRSASPDGYYTIKLTDFGSATRNFISDNLTTNRGTPKWMAPEMLAPPGNYLKVKYTKSVDVYGFAMICYQVITSFTPFSFSEIKSGRNVIEAIMTGNVRPSFPEQFTCPQDLKQLIIDCWDGMADSRPDFIHIRERLWNIRRDAEMGIDLTLMTRNRRIAKL